MLGYGTKLKVGDGATPTENFALIGEVKDIDDGDDIELKEATNHSSPGRRREYISGLIDGGEMSFVVNYDADAPTHNRITGLKSMLGQTRNFRIEEPGTATGYQFAAVIQSLGNSYPVDDIMEMNVTLKKTGDLTSYTIV